MWAQIINALLGVWLMAAPAVLGYGTPAQTNDRIVGPVIATFAVVACWEATRNLRWANLPLAAWLLLAPWILGYGSTAAIVNSMVIAVVVGALSLVRGHVEKSYAGGWRALLSGDTDEAAQTTSANAAHPSA